MINNQYGKDVNPKVVRTIIWRVLTNISKHSETTKTFLFENAALIFMSLFECLKNNKSDAAVINAATMAANNFLFVPEFPFEEIPREELVTTFGDTLSSENENTVVAILNSFCRLIKSDSDFKTFFKKSGLALIKAKFDTLKYHSSQIVKDFVEDIYFLLEN